MITNNEQVDQSKNVSCLQFLNEKTNGLINICQNTVNLWSAPWRNYLIRIGAIGMSSGIYGW